MDRFVYCKYRYLRVSEGAPSPIPKKDQEIVSAEKG